MSSDGSIDPELVWRRRAYLGVLTTEPQPKAALVEALDVSRSTVNRAMAGLGDAGLVEDVAGGCRLTLAGRLVAEALGTCRDHLDGVEEVRELLPALSSDAGVGLDLVRGAEAHPARGAAPHQPYHVFERLIGESERLRGAARTFSNPRSREVFDELAMERGVPVELYLAPSLLEQVRETYPGSLERWVEEGAFSARVVTDPPRHTILVSERPAGDRAGVAFYTEANEFQGVLVNDADEAVRWARERLDALAERAVPLSRHLAEEG